MSENKNRCTWSKEETKHLLELMKDKKVMELLDGKTRRNKNLYVLLAMELSKKGYNKTSEQTKVRFRTLKKQYHSTKWKNGKSGAGRHTMDYFAELDEVLGDRPVAAAVGLDTTVESEMLEVEILEGESLDEDFLMEELQDVCEESQNVASGSQQHAQSTRKKKRSGVQQTLLDIAEDVKKSHQRTLNVLEKENDSFLLQQRQLQEEFLNASRELMAEDRRETKQMLMDILNLK